MNFFKTYLYILLFLKLLNVCTGIRPNMVSSSILDVIFSHLVQAKYFIEGMTSELINCFVISDTL